MTNIHSNQTNGDFIEIDDLLDLGLSNRLTVVVGSDADERNTELEDWLQRREIEAIRIDCPSSEDLQGCTSALYDAFASVGITEPLENGEVARDQCLPRLVALLNSLASLPRDIVVVFRDYQPNEGADRVLSFMLEHLPQQVHLYITCDSVPCLNCIPRLRVRRQLQTIETD